MTNDTPSTANNANNSNAAVAALNTGRKKWIALISGTFALIGIAYGAYWGLVLRHLQSTDDAYVNGNVVQITPQISGIVISVGADDTQYVKAGQALVKLDQADAKVALDQAEAQLSKTVREVRTLFATSSQLQAAVDVRQSDLAKANDDLARRERLAKSGAVSNEELQHAHEAFNSAKSALIVAQQQLAASHARIDNTTVDNHPDVLNAAAHVHDAYLTYARTELPAPVSGFVAKRTVQLGQRVNPGANLMAIVPLDQVWIDANFKEPQLANMRAGQSVTIKSDLYGGSIEYHGKVIGFGAGTGSAFALLPAQNATGNWIKIVQRVPVRIALDAKELAAHPLQIGLSMQVTVDTHNSSGDRLPQLAHAAPTYQTDVFHSVDAAADQRVKTIIAANESASPTPLHAKAAEETVATRRLVNFRAAPVASNDRTL